MVDQPDSAAAEHGIAADSPLSLSLGSLASLGSPLNARPFGRLPHVIFRGKTFDS